MTLAEVMQIQGRELDALIAEKITGELRWNQDRSRAVVGSSLAIEIFPAGVRERYHFNEDGSPCWTRGDGDRWFTEAVLHYSTDWNAAMRIREWARSLKGAQSIEWAGFVKQCAQIRLGLSDFAFAALLKAEPVDFARAALLVSSEAVAAAEKQAER